MKGCRDPDALVILYLGLQSEFGEGSGRVVTVSKQDELKTSWQSRQALITCLTHRAQPLAQRCGSLPAISAHTFVQASRHVNLHAYYQETIFDWSTPRIPRAVHTTMSPPTIQYGC